MKITMYELLGLVKDGKAPKKIKYKNKIYEWKEYDVCYGKIMTKKGWAKEYGYVAEENGTYFYLKHCYQDLNDTVEILEEEKKIPEKILTIRDVSGKNSGDINHNFSIMWYKMNEIIDYLDYLKSKGE